MTVAGSIKAQLDEAAQVMRQQMARIAELEAEVERLKSAANAHDVLKEIYANPNQPIGHRIKAAQAALPHEVPRLESVPPVLELAAEEVIPLADLIAQRRARHDRMLLEDPQYRLKGNGNDSDSDDYARSPRPILDWAIVAQ
jgi:hypothetical protein